MLSRQLRVDNVGVKKGAKLNLDGRVKEVICSAGKSVDRIGGLDCDSQLVTTVTAVVDSFALTTTGCVRVGVWDSSVLLEDLDELGEGIGGGAGVWSKSATDRESMHKQVSYNISSLEHDQLTRQ